MRNSPSALEFAIVRAVAYAAVFEYPLTTSECQQSLPDCMATEAQVRVACQTSLWLRDRIAFRDGMVCALGCEDWVEQRRVREAASLAFLRRHRRLLRALCLLPFVRLLAVSGSVAHLNADPGADLDVFIVTRGRRVWSVALGAVLLAKLLRRRRIVCANFVMSDERMQIAQQDLFVANQVIHLRPLTGGDLCASFLAANGFVHTTYPNFAGWTSLPLHAAPGRMACRIKRACEWLLTVPWLAVEWSSRALYRHHLRTQSARWQSPQQVVLDDDYVKLHTQSHRHSVMDRYDAMLARLVESPAGVTSRVAV